MRKGKPSRRLDDADCSDDPEWYHKNRGPDYDCAWVALKTDTRCAVKGISLCGNSILCGCRRNRMRRKNLFTETSFPIAIVPLDVCDKLPIPGQFMDTLRAANSSECNQGIYEALMVSYDTFAAEQPFYRLWDSGAVMYYLDPDDYGEPEVTEICIGTSWTYLGGLFRKSKVDEDVPPCVEINQ